MCDATHNLSESLRRTVRDAIQLSPTTPDSLGCCRKGAAHMGKKDKRLWRDSLLFQAAKTGAEVGSTASLRSELYGLTRLVGFNLLHFSIEVQNMDEPRLLTCEDGPG